MGFGACQLFYWSTVQETLSNTKLASWTQIGSNQRSNQWGDSSMPIYEYTCQDCGAPFEKLVRSMTAQVEVKCPSCGSGLTKKGWSVFGTGKSNGEFGGLAASSASSCSPGGT
jgi:putative FmdB family regulatory protein